MQESKYFHLLIILIIIISSGCASIDKTFYDKHSNSYKASMKHLGIFTIRKPDGSKVTNQNTLNTILSNPKAMVIILKRRGKDVSYNTAYRVGDIYYKGIKAMYNNDFKKALSHFINAKIKFPKVGWISDINYLMGVCYIKLNRIDMAKKALVRFLSHSDRVIPNSFNKHMQRNWEFHKLIKNAETYLSVLKNGKTPKISNAIFPHKVDDNQSLIVDTYDGFTILANKGKRYRPFTYVGLSSYSEVDKIIMGSSMKGRLTSSLDFFLNAGNYFSSSDDDLLLFETGVAYQLLKTKNNRFGIRFSPYFSYTINDFTKEHFDQLSFRLSATAYPATWFFVYTGVRQPVIRYSFIDDDKKITGFNEGSYFAGIGLRLFSSDINLKMLINNNKWIVTADLNNLQLGYNITDSSFYINTFYLKY